MAEGGTTFNSFSIVLAEEAALFVVGVPWVGFISLVNFYFKSNTHITFIFKVPGDLLDPGIEPTSLAAPALQMHSLLLNHQGSPAPLLKSP